MISTIESSRANQRPTRVRFVVVGLVILLGMVTYLDRACIGTLEDPIMRDLKLSQHELSYAHTACRRLSMMLCSFSMTGSLGSATPGAVGAAQPARVLTR
jgi:hypothetical protein